MSKPKTVKVRRRQPWETTSSDERPLYSIFTRRDPDEVLAEVISNELNPPAPVRTLKDMTKREQAEMRRLYDRRKR